MFRSAMYRDALLRMFVYRRDVGGPYGYLPA